MSIGRDARGEGGPPPREWFGIPVFPGDGPKTPAGTYRPLPPLGSLLMEVLGLVVLLLALLRRDAGGFSESEVKEDESSESDRMIPFLGALFCERA